MPKTLLAVDDSATMRKVFEITFSGEDYRVIAVDSGSSALEQLGQSPNVVLIDTSLGEDAYALAKEIRGRAPAATLLLLASRYSPYDANKGRDAGADDFIDKPFDTQQILDKVKKAMLARESGAVAAPAAAPPVSAKSTLPGAPAIPSATSPSIQSPFQQPNRTQPQPVAISAAPTTPAPAVAVVKPASSSRSHTLSFENSPYAAPPAAPPPKPVIAAPPPPPPPPPAPPPPAPKPVVLATAPAPAAAPTAPPPVAAAVNGQLAGKLGELGLTSAQVDAVLALSREVVERVVWEVVPQLAETMIREEIARLTKE